MTSPSSNSLDTLMRLAAIIDSRKPAAGGDPQASYVARLFHKGPDAVLKKIGEEATETVMAAKDGDPARIIAETADLWFHCLVMLAQYKLRPEAVLAELARREGLSGLDEKALRKALERSRDETPGDARGEGSTGLVPPAGSPLLSSQDPSSRKP